MTAIEWVKESIPKLKELVAQLESEVTALREESREKELHIMHLQGLIALHEVRKNEDKPNQPRIAVYRYSISDAIDEVLNVSPEPINAASMHVVIKDYEVFLGVTDLLKSIWNALARGCRTNRYKKEGRGLYRKL